MVPTVRATTVHRLPSKQHAVGGQTAGIVVHGHRAVAPARHRAIQHQEVKTYEHYFRTDGEGTA